MTVIGLQDFLSAAIARQVQPANLRASAAVNIPAPSAPAPAEAAASSSTIPALSLDTAAFNSASSSVAQYGSVLQIAHSGADDIQTLLQQLQDLAGQPAAGTVVTTAQLAQINGQFQQILNQINRIAASTTFNGASILDGTYSSQQSTPLEPDQIPQPPISSLPNLTTKALFGDAQPNLLTAEAAAQAFALVSGAKNTASKASSDIEETQEQVELASASLQTALTNIDASTALLSASDLAGVFENLLGTLTTQPSGAAQLQTANLSPSLLSLLQE